MKTLGVYDSFFGNTEKIAQAIGEALGSQMDAEVQPGGRCATGAVDGLYAVDRRLADPGTPVHTGHQLRLRDGGLMVALLILATGGEATLKAWPVRGWAVAPYALAGAALGVLAAWLGLTLLLHLVARTLGGTGGYRALLARMGLAAAPMVLTSLVSSALYVILPVLWPGDWEPLHTLVGWIGMTGGWPGLLTYYALRHAEGLSPGRAGAVVAAIYLLTLVGWFLPALMLGWFG